MTPHFVTFDCKDCDEEFKKKECFDNGRFCALNHKNVKNSGQEIIKEDIRQACVYNQSIAKKGTGEYYWKYMKRAHQISPEYINEDTSKTAHKDVGLDFEATKKCLLETFGVDKAKNIKYTSFNTFLESERTYWNNYGANFYPSIVINNRTYRGVFEPQAIFEAICAGFKKQPNVCNMKDIREGSGVSTKTVLIIVISLILFNIVLLLCYRRV